MGGSDHCDFFFYVVATVDVLMANSNNVNLAKPPYVWFA